MLGFMKVLFIVFLCFSIAGCATELTVNKDNVLFEIKKGESFHNITKRLKSENIIKNTTRFQILAKLMRKDMNFKFGVYQIKKGERYIDLIDKFASGDTFSIKITIPEGYNIYQIASVLSENGLISEEEFLETCKDKELISEFNLKKNPTLEGYLYPDTYYIPLNYEKKKIIRLFLDNFNRIIDNDFLTKIHQKGLTLNNVMIMASIIEKEAKQEFEKPIIAGVYYNRLKKGMRLQADPTLIYALTLTGTYNGSIGFKDFNIDSKYNTYKYYGMPPGPIANPGRASILAAIFPTDVGYLYFVAKPDGSHYFSSTLEEHNKAVYLYQKLPAYEKRRKMEK